MPKKKASRNAQGGGTIRQRKDGRWEARFTVGRDPGTGKQLQRSIYGDTQTEVRKKLVSAVVEVDESIYLAPVKQTVSQWLDTWVEEYCRGLKPYTLLNYKSKIKNHIKPLLGAVKVQDVTPDMIQHAYNKMLDKGLSPKSLRNIHGILHSAFETLIDNRELRFNPAAPCHKRLPKVVKKEMQTMSDAELSRFFEVIQGEEFEHLFKVDLFTGLRQGELLGLRWSCIDVENGCITVDRQLYMPTEKGGKYTLQPLKNRKTRVIHPAPFVFDELREIRKEQLERRMLAGSEWTPDIPDLVFTDEHGQHISHKTAYKHFKQCVEASGIPDVRFHDMRHTYAVLSLQAGDDVKTVQENLGHHDAGFTLNTYGHVSEAMKKASAERMQKYIESISK